MNKSRRLVREDGFSLIELLVVLTVIGVLLAIAVPSYMGFTGRANQKAADADIRSALPGIENLYSTKGSYSSLTLTKIRASYDSGAKFAGYHVSDTGQTYCISIKLSGKWAWVQRGKTTLANGDVQESVPAASCQ